MYKCFKNYKKVFRVFSIVLVLITVLIMVISCSSGNEQNSDMEAKLEQACRDRIHALMTGDIDYIYNGTNKELYSQYQELSQSLQGVESYELRLLEASQDEYFNGLYRYSRIYEATFDGKRTFVIEMIVTEGDDNYVGATGSTIFNMSETTKINTVIESLPLKVFIIGMTLISWLFCAIMLIDCLRRKLMHKWIWIIVILFGFSVSISLGTGFDISYFIAVMIMPSTAIYNAQTAMTTIKLVLPMGALVYFLSRKQMTISNIKNKADEKIT